MFSVYIILPSDLVDLHLALWFYSTKGKRRHEKAECGGFFLFSIKNEIDLLQ